MEEWKPIQGYEDSYEISSLGRVRSLERTIINSLGRECLIHGGILKIMTNPKGYQHVHLAKNGKAVKHRIHRLVGEHFIPNDNPNLIVRHGPNGKSDNSVDNLCWGTNSENMLDKRRDGTDVRHSQTQCLRGHEYTKENLLLSKSGKRSCRACSLARHQVKRSGGDLQEISDIKFKNINKKHTKEFI